MLDLLYVLLTVVFFAAAAAYVAACRSIADPESGPAAEIDDPGARR